MNSFYFPAAKDYMPACTEGAKLCARQLTCLWLGCRTSNWLIWWPNTIFYAQVTLRLCQLTDLCTLLCHMVYIYLTQ